MLILKENSGDWAFALIKVSGNKKKSKRNNFIKYLYLLL
jgi:hypothetical protein